MTRPRQELAAALTVHLPTNYRVIDHQDSIDRVDVGRPVVMVFHHTIRPRSGYDVRAVELDVLVVVPELSPGKADDAVDDALDVLLDAIRKTDQVVWESAERIAFGDAQYPAYRVTVTAVATTQ